MKLIIFDCDGVLRNASWQHIYQAYKKLITAMGKKPETFFTDFVSFKKWCDVDWHKNEMRISGTDEYVPNPQFHKIFHESYDSLITLFPWVSETLPHLSKKYTLAVLSSSTKTSVENSLGELSRYFSFIIGSEEVKSLKPNPEGVLLALKLSDTPANEALMIGDMNVDFLAGKNAGIKTGLVFWGLGEREELRALKADYYFERYEDLLKL